MTGSTSPTGVPAHPPSAKARRPPSIRSPPPRLLTKSAIMRSCSGENEAASTLPRINERYSNSSSRVFGKPSTSSSGSPTSRRRYLFSAVRCRMTTCRFLSSSTARRMNLASKRGSPSKYRIFSRRSLTSMSAWRVLFCATCSLACAGTRKRNSRGPASDAVKLHADRGRLAIRREGHLLRADNPPFVFDVERHFHAGVTTLREHDVDDQRRSLQRGSRRLDSRNLNVAREFFLTDADGEHRNRSGLQAGNRFVERGVGRVGAVGDHDQPCQRQARRARRAPDRAHRPVASCCLRI